MHTFRVGDRVIAHAIIGGVEVVKPAEILEVGADYLVANSGKLRQYFPLNGVIGKRGMPGHVWLTPVADFLGAT